MKFGRLIATGIAAVALTFTAAGAAPSAAGQRPDTVVVRGDVEHRLKLTAADLAALPQVSVTVSFLSGSGSQSHTFTGPLLLDVIDLAGPGFDPAIKNDKLAHVVTATGSDGYRATVAWGELDPDFENNQILLAITQDGTPLGDAGPRLVVPGDSHGGRYVSDVVNLRLVDA
jgi:DMSO/TMAO reductase YedYZ molybdopterin-dependent catalytic subunit